MIINKIDNNNYIIKIINTTLDIYKPNILEEITTKIIKQIRKTNTIRVLSNKRIRYNNPT